MCEVCEQKEKRQIVQLLKDVLGADFSIKFIDKREWQEVEILNLKNGKTLLLAADGDNGGYFHYREL